MSKVFSSDELAKFGKIIEIESRLVILERTLKVNQAKINAIKIDLVEREKSGIALQNDIQSITNQLIVIRNALLESMTAQPVDNGIVSEDKSDNIEGVTRWQKEV